MPTLSNIQSIIQLSQMPQFTLAVAAFDQATNPVTTAAQIAALKDHYFNVVYTFDQVRQLVGDERVADYGRNSPEAMIEYVQDRATEAAASVPTDDELSYTEPTDDAQSEPLYWIESEASGSASASA